VSAVPDALPAELAARLTSDPWARSLGIEFLELRRGYCRLALPLQPHMLNFQGAPHGGVIFSLADVAFSLACNSHGVPAVALSVTISYLAAAPPGGRLVAEGRERKQGRRAGFYDITVSTAGGTVVAVVHCVAHRVATREEA
jgi:acyl-CoA thioesterase